MLKSYASHNYFRVVRGIGDTFPLTNCSLDVWSTSNSQRTKFEFCSHLSSSFMHILVLSQSLNLEHFA